MKEEEMKSLITDFKNTLGILKKEKTEFADSFLSFSRSVHKEGDLSVKEKELISLGISIFARCKACIVMHTRSALNAGATRGEILEACGTALMMGGNSLINYVSVALDALNVFLK